MNNANIQLNTFCTDRLQGRFNDDVLWIANKWKEKMSVFLIGYIKDCYNENIESSSVDGILLSIIQSALLSARLSLMLEIGEERNGERQD